MVSSSAALNGAKPHSPRWVPPPAVQNSPAAPWRLKSAPDRPEVRVSVTPVEAEEPSVTSASKAPVDGNAAAPLATHHSREWFAAKLTAFDTGRSSHAVPPATGAHPDPEILSLVATAGIDHLPELLSAATELHDAERACLVIDQCWKTQPAALVVLAAFVQIAPRLPLTDLIDWAGRVRARGLDALCPLMARTRDTSRSTAERVEAAHAAWQRYSDPGARAVLESLGESVPTPVTETASGAVREIASHVPLGARTILEVGGPGPLGATIAYRQPALVRPVAVADASVGAEPDGRHDDDDGRWPVDAVVATDVLEHVEDPWAVVGELGRMLRPGGVVVANLPNIAHLGVIASLVAGSFDYDGGGAVDRSHLRFFAPATVGHMFSAAGLEVEAVEPLRDAVLFPVEAPPEGKAVDLDLGHVLLKHVDRHRLEQLNTRSFVVTARKREPLPSLSAPAVWDCVLFYNELDMLEARLEELEGIVNHVVVVESEQTFRGDRKSLTFAENSGRFDRFDVAFHHVAVQTDPALSAWERERVQRDAGLQALSGAAPDDLVLVCDVDEIVRRATIDDIITATQSGPVSLDMAFYYYSLGWRSPQEWRHPKALRARDLPWSLDALRRTATLPAVTAAGWHLSYFGGEEQIHQKLRSYSHAEYDSPQVHDAVESLVANGMTVHDIQLARVHDEFPDHFTARFPGGPPGELPEAAFHEEWYPEPQLHDLVGLLRTVVAEGVDGELVEIGCWEGRSTVALAHGLAGTDRSLHAVDWWLGNTDEGTAHPSVTAARTRDVYQTFLQNIAPYPHVSAHRQEGGEFLRTFDRTIAFIHLDAGHTYAATKALIDAALPMLAPGAIICGDDYQNSHAGRTDLGGGVECAVRDAFHGEARALGNLWLFRRPAHDPAWWPAHQAPTREAIDAGVPPAKR